jgi:hypothetical protein
MLNATDKKLLKEVADLHEIPQGAYNIRKNGTGEGRRTTANIDIVTKADKPGIDVIIKPNTKNESVHIPVILSQSMDDLVYNTFAVGENSDVVIVAGCGIHNTSGKKAEHDGVHEFFVRRGARMRYIEKHFGEGDDKSERVLNPTTIIEIEEGGVAELEMAQIKGVDSTKRDTLVKLHRGARLIVTERLLTYLDQFAESNITVELLEETLRPRSYRALWRRTRRDRYSTWFCAGMINAGAYPVRFHHHGRRAGLLHPGDHGASLRRQPDTRGRHRQDCLGTADETDVPRSHGTGSRGNDPQGISCLDCSSINIIRRLSK